VTKRRRRWSVFGARRPSHDLFRSFSAAGANLRQAAELSDELLGSWPDRGDELRREITLCEQEGDRLTHSIKHTLYRSRALPFDRQDAYALASAVDDVVDDIEEASEELAMYQIEAPLEQAQRLAAILRDSGRALAAALDGLARFDGIEAQHTEIRRLEHEGDRVYREGLSDLFEGGIDPMLIIRWKDVLGALEAAIDRCRQASDILQGMVVKYS
jgi:predicted phosphate transport protein (TIGR00153 family)